MTTRTRIFLSLLTLLLLISAQFTAAYADPVDPLQYVADQYSEALAELIVADEFSYTFEITAATVVRHKVQNQRTGALYLVTTDEQMELVDYDGLVSAEAAARQSQYGNLEPHLADLIASLNDTDLIPVALWLDTTGVNFPTRNPTAPDGGVNLDTLANEIAMLQQPLATDLRQAGVDVGYQSSLMPVMYITPTVSTLNSLAQRREIDTIYALDEQYEDLMSNAKPTQKADIVNDWFGYDGSGIHVSILEDSRVVFNNPFLNNGETRKGNHPADQHATGTAGIVASQHDTHEGVAQGVELYSANAKNYMPHRISDAMDWSAYDKDVDIINNSWGNPGINRNLGIYDRHLDYIVRHTGKTVVVAAGNEGAGCGGDAWVGKPARAYNVITVGNYADQGTITWDDDVMDTCSSFVDPSTGAEKPEVAAVGGATIMSTTDVNPWIGNIGAGTSYAAPMVSGQAALLMERDPQLRDLAESVKAIIMASAVHNIEGSQRLSEQDGAGGVDMRESLRVVDNGWWSWQSVTENSFPMELPVNVPVGTRMRVVAVWGSDPNSIYTSDPLRADIDMRLYDPNDNFVTSSVSSSNPFEIIDTTINEAGAYTLQISESKFSGDKEYLGLAWWLEDSRTLNPDAAWNYGAPPITHDYFDFAIDNSSNSWQLLTVRDNEDANNVLRLYDGAAWDDPEDYNFVEESHTTQGLAWLAIDGNKAPTGSYFPEVETVGGIEGGYRISRHANRGTFTIGSYGPYTIGNDPADIWQWSVNGNTDYYVRLEMLNGEAGVRVHDSITNDQESIFQERFEAGAYIDPSWSNQHRLTDYNSPTTDVLGFVVHKSEETLEDSAEFRIHIDTTPPTGCQIFINNGQAHENDHSVTLNVQATDAETGIWQVRFHNEGEDWSQWFPYAQFGNWILSNGEGNKTVTAQFRNNAGMEGGTCSDTILVDTGMPDSITTPPPPTSPPGFRLTWGGSDNDGSGIATYLVEFQTPDGEWHIWLRDTTDTGANFGPVEPVQTIDGEQYGFRVTATDHAGNVGRPSAAVYTTIDSNAVPTAVTMQTMKMSSAPPIPLLLVFMLAVGTVQLLSRRRNSTTNSVPRRN